MRTYLLVIFSALALGGLFLAIWSMQSAPKGSDRTEIANQPVPGKPTTEQTIGPIHGGEHVQLKHYDDRGQLVSSFEGDKFVPRSDGTIDVTHPIAKFFLANRQHVEIHGQTGNVVIKDAPQATANGFGAGGPPAPPSRGRLNDVIVTLQDDAKNATLLTMTTNNVVFDNDTFRIATEGYRENGVEIADDQVPVRVTGEIKMEGRGMTIRWNDKDGRLELLEIAHGDVLEITDPSALSIGGAKSGRGERAGASEKPLSQPLVDASSNGAATALSAASPPASGPSEINMHPPAPSVIYQASFYDHVRINQPSAESAGDQILIKDVDRMDVDFLLKQSGPQTSSPTTAPAQPHGPQTHPVATTQPSVAATQPAAKREPPVFVHWTGVLRITPLKSAPPVPLLPGDTAVTMFGEPVSIRRVEPKNQGSEDIRCASVLYQTAGEKVWLGKSEQVPRIFVTKFPAAAAKDQTPSKLVSEGTVQYSRIDQNVLLTGKGDALVPLEPQAKDPHPKLAAAWSKLARFDFLPVAGSDQPVVREGHFEGDVDINHPQLNLASQTLDLHFSPPAAGATEHKSEPDLQQVVATTDVKCRVEGSDGKQQFIDCNRLVMDTAHSQGKLFARHINATGKVHAYGEDDLRAQFVDLLLKPSSKSKIPSAPSTQPVDQTAQVELEKLVAREDVVAKSKDGSVAVGDELTVTTENGQQHTLLSSLGGQVSVTDAKGNIVRGPSVTFDSADGAARIVGPGSIHAIQQASTTQPAQPVDVTFAGNALFNGNENHIDVDQTVLAKSIDKRGYVDTADADHIHVDLRAKPTTQPAQTQPAIAASDKSGGMKMDPFKGKEVAALNLQGKARLLSTLSAVNGDVLQQFELKGPNILINEFDAAGLPNRTLTIPAAGQMLARDHRPVDKQAKASSDDQGGSARGATAFQWSQKFLYAESGRRADMIGDVLIVHQDDDTTQPPVRLTCQHVIAWFESAAPKSDATTVPAEDHAPMQLHYLTAEGPTVVVTRDTDQVTARQIDYDPKRHVLIATGTQQNPVRFSTTTNGSGSADRVEWDTVTWKMKTGNVVYDYQPQNPGVIPPPNHKKKP